MTDKQIHTAYALALLKYNRVPYDVAIYHSQRVPTEDQVAHLKFVQERIWNS